MHRVDSNPMEVTLSRFVHALRSAEVPVSPAETLDGFQVVQQVGIGNPRLLEDSLALVLAKSREEKARFTDCFARFFHQLAFQEPPKRTILRNLDIEAVMALVERHGDEKLSKVLESVLHDEQSYLAFLVQEQAERSDLASIKTLRDKTTHVDQLSRALAIPSLEKLLATAGDGSSANMESISSLRYLRQYLQQQVRAYVDAQYQLHVDASGRKALIEAALSGSLDQIPAGYFDEVDRVVHKLAQRLARHHRRRRKRAHRGSLDIKRMIRDNVAYDGTFFNLRWRHKRERRSTVYVVCDVSKSMSRLSRFLLLFLHDLSDVLPRIRSFVFSNRLGEVTELFADHGHERAVEEALFRWGNGSTDYGCALVDFRGL
ncbi:MAG: VWA domain-containing protein, partial [Gammaproteobacteria bacterium]|nr:VWA domain-containing protein [Gammaproteobacteria bacterium]